MKKIVSGNPWPNIPWEDRFARCMDVVWSSARNPIITHGTVPMANSIFNSAVMPYQDNFILAEQESRRRAHSHRDGRS